MGGSVRDEIKDAVRSTLEDLLEGYVLGKISILDLVDEAVVSIADGVFNIVGLAPDKEYMPFDYVRYKKEGCGE